MVKLVFDSLDLKELCDKHGLEVYLSEEPGSKSYVFEDVVKQEKSEAESSVKQEKLEVEGSPDVIITLLAELTSEAYSIQISDNGKDIHSHGDKFDAELLKKTMIINGVSYEVDVKHTKIE